MLSIQDEAAGGDRVRVLASVSGTGMGARREDTGKLFRSYCRVDASTTRLHGGTGLGRAISRQLARLMGGDLTLAARSESGATLALELVLPASVDAPPTHHDAGVVPYFAGKSALLVDHNLTNLRILEFQLARQGMTCWPFDSPEAALEAVAGGVT